MSLADVIDDALEVLTAFSVPLYVNDEYGRPSLHGTGFFIRVGAEHFLVSAAHVIDTAFTRGLYFYTAPDTIRRLSGTVFRSSRVDSRDADLIDVGVVKLTKDSVPPYPDVNKFAMDPEYLHPQYLPRGKRSYSFIGFPATKSKVDRTQRSVLASPYAFHCKPVPDYDYARHGVSPETHLLLHLDLKVGFDVTGKHQHFPKPQGMSGSPIIVLYSDNEGSDEPRVFPVVAIATRYRQRDRAVIGTDIGYVLDALHRAA